MSANTSSIKPNPAEITSAHPAAVRYGKDVLTVVEVALELRCSKSHVHHLIAGSVRGMQPLPSLWLGRRRVVRRCSLNAWIEANEHGAVL